VIAKRNLDLYPKYKGEENDKTQCLEAPEQIPTQRPEKISAKTY